MRVKNEVSVLGRSKMIGIYFMQVLKRTKTTDLIDIVDVGETSTIVKLRMYSFFHILFRTNYLGRITKAFKRRRESKILLYKLFFILIETLQYFNIYTLSKKCQSLNNFLLDKIFIQI